MKKTPAEEQMEELKRLRETLGKRKAAPPPRAKTKPAVEAMPSTAATTGSGPFELSEHRPKVKKSGPTLPLSPETYRRLLELHRESRVIKRKKDLGDWAAALAMAVPLSAQTLSDDAKAELFKRMKEWADARGLQ